MRFLRRIACMLTGHQWVNRNLFRVGKLPHIYCTCCRLRLAYGMMPTGGVYADDTEN